MKPIFRTLAVALTFASLGIGAAMAQTIAPGSNPVQRGSRDPFFYGPLGGQTQGQPPSGPLGNDAIKRPMGNRPGAVTPVPEPSQWAMMLAGLALVGVIVKRRNNAR